MMIIRSCGRHILSQDLYVTEVQYRTSQHLALTSASPRKQLYAPVLSRVRVVMISRMAKPEEVSKSLSRS